jgi:hypothetical protein
VVKSQISSGDSRDENRTKVGAGFAEKRVDSDVSVTQSACIGEKGACSHYKLTTKGQINYLPQVTRTPLRMRGSNYPTSKPP